MTHNLNKSTWAFDIGNTVIKWGKFNDQGQLITKKQCPYFDDLKQLLLEDATEHTDVPDKISISSVVPDVEAQLIFTLQEQLQNSAPINWYLLNRKSLTSDLLTEGQLGPLDLSRYESGQIGADRVADMLGSIEKHPNQNRLVIDVGTMTTFDLLDQNNAYLGGAIAPGPRKFQSLTSTTHAAQLFEIDLFQHKPDAAGKSTEECLEIGFYLGYQGLLGNIATYLLKTQHWPAQETHWILTGGDSQAIATMLEAQCQINVTLEPDLTLQGLHQLTHYCLPKQLNRA